MKLEDKLEKIVLKHKELSDKLSDPSAFDSKEFIRISKEFSELEGLVEKIDEFKAAKKDFNELSEIVSDPESDSEMKELAGAELEGVKQTIPTLEEGIKILLLPKDEANEKNAILEVRAGTGGEEAALFAANLFGMYQKYAEKHGWKFEILSLSGTGIGGFKEASATITGTNVFERMKFESGVYRVQRVPETESQGRVHTSAATVAVLPEAEEVDLHIDDKDLKIDIFRASGPGGQSVNTTDSAVRITHIPTGIVVSQQDEKSQHKNKAKGMKILRARIYEHERQQKDAERAASRKSQIGSGDRSERIRTYNFPQGRVSDHRINLTLYKIDEIINEGELDEIMDALIAEDQASRLAEAV